MSRALPPSPPLHRRSTERGSAFVMVLFLILAMTAIGLSLTLVTQTEIFIASSERNVTRTSYFADSALQIQLASTLVNGDEAPRTIRLGERTLVGGVLYQDRVDLSPFFPIFAGTCNLCMVNQDSQYHAINHVVSAYARRGEAPSDPTQDEAADLFNVQAERGQLQMFALQPWQQTISAYQTSTQDDIEGIGQAPEIPGVSEESGS